MEPGPGVKLARARLGRQPAPASLRKPCFQGGGRVLHVDEYDRREDEDVAGPDDLWRDPRLEAGRDLPRDPRRDPLRDSGRDPRQDPRRDSGRDPRQDPRRDSGRDPRQDPRRDSGRDPRRDLRRDSGRDPRRDSGQDPRGDPWRVPSGQRAGSRSSGASGGPCGQGLKRPATVLAAGSHSPAARCRCPAKRVRALEPEVAASDESDGSGTPPGSPGPAARAEEPAEPGAQLLLVLCGASALRAQWSGLRRLLRQLRDQDPRPPAALLGVLLQPRPGEEASARRRLEELLCEVFGTGEVHTAVFGPGRPQGALDVRRASRQAPRCPRMDRQTQTDGPRSC
ncbi:uncharacterized protein RHO17_022741 [Thomomys bottae]